MASTPAVIIALDELSLEHAWHAELLIERLPERAGFDRDSALDLGGVAPALELLASLGGAGDEVGLLAGYARVLLPRFALSIDELGGGASEAAERSLRRAARLISSDLSAAAGIVESLTERVAASEGASGHARAVCGDLEAILGPRVGIAGP